MPAEAFGDIERSFDRRLWQNHDEFLTAVASGNVGIPQFASDQLGQVLQHLVADFVAVGVVDLFEKVNVKHQDTHLTIISQGFGKDLSQSGPDSTGIEQPGQPVYGGQFIEPGLFERPDQLLSQGAEHFFVLFGKSLRLLTGHADDTQHFFSASSGTPIQER